MSQILNKEQFFSSFKPKIKQITVNGSDLFIRTLSGAQRAKLGDALRKLGDNPGIEDSSREFVYRSIALAVVDEQGNRLFTDTDIEVIGEQDSSAIDTLTKEILRASGLNPEAITEAKNA